MNAGLADKFSRGDGGERGLSAEGGDSRLSVVCVTDLQSGSWRDQCCEEASDVLILRQVRHVGGLLAGDLSSRPYDHDTITLASGTACSQSCLALRHGPKLCCAPRPPSTLPFLLLMKKLGPTATSRFTEKRAGSAETRGLFDFGVLPHW